MLILPLIIVTNPSADICCAVPFVASGQHVDDSVPRCRLEIMMLVYIKSRLAQG